MNERLKQIIDWFQEHNLADGISASELFEKMNPLTSRGILSCRSEIAQVSRDLIRLYDMGMLGRILEEKINGVYRYHLLPEKDKPFVIVKQNQVSCSLCGTHYSTRDSYPVWCEKCGGCLSCCSCDKKKEKGEEDLVTEQVISVITDTRGKKDLDIPGIYTREIPSDIQGLRKYRIDLDPVQCVSLFSEILIDSSPTGWGDGIELQVKSHYRKGSSDLVFSDIDFTNDGHWKRNFSFKTCGAMEREIIGLWFFEIAKCINDVYKLYGLEKKKESDPSCVNFEELSNYLLNTARPIFVEMLKKDRAECEAQYKSVIDGLQTSLIEKDKLFKAESGALKEKFVENNQLSIKLREQDNQIRELVRSVERNLELRKDQNERIIELEKKCKALEEQKTKIVYEDMRNKMGIKFRDLCEEEIKNNKLVMKCG